MTTENQTPLISIPEDEFEEMLSRAAERGALRALADVGLDGEHAQENVRALRSLLQAFKLAKETAWQTIVRILTAGFLAALMAGIAVKLKLFGAP